MTSTLPECCTPGFIVNAYALLAAHPHPDPETVRAWLESNLCRCTGYEGIQRAVDSAGARQGQESPEIDE